MKIFKMFLIVLMHLVSIWAFSCLFRFLNVTSNPEVTLPVKTTITMVTFYGGLTLMTVFYWIAWLYNRKKSNSIEKVQTEVTENNENSENDAIKEETVEKDSETIIEGSNNSEKISNETKSSWFKTNKQYWLILWHVVALVFLYNCLFSVSVHSKEIRIGYLFVPYLLIIWGIIAVSPIFYWLKKFIKINADIIVKVVKFTVISILALLSIAGIGIGIYKVVNANSLPKCDSQFAEEHVVAIFKQNNGKYKEFASYGLVGDVSISLITPESYDKDIQKYECSARITVLPDTSRIEGLPSFIRDRGIYENQPIAYGLYERGICNVNYSIYKEHGENTVSSYYCGNHLEMEGSIESNAKTFLW